MVTEILAAIGDKSSELLMVQDQGGWTALHAAARYGTDAMIQDILAAIGDGVEKEQLLELMTHDQNTAQDIAWYAGRTKTILRAL